MKDFISELLRHRGLEESFWSQSFTQIIVTPPTPRKVSITKAGDTVTIREAHNVGSWWLSESASFSDDTEMAFRVTEDGSWIPLYVKEGANKARFAYTIRDESFSPKPIVSKRQLSFSARWAEKLTLKGLIQGLVEIAYASSNE